MSSASSRAMLRVLRRLSASRSGSGAAWEPAATTTSATSGSSSTTTLPLFSFARQQQPPRPSMISAAAGGVSYSTTVSSSTRVIAAALPLFQQQRRAIATGSAAASAAADPPPPSSDNQPPKQQGPQHSPLQAFVPQIPFSDDELEQLGGAGEGEGGDDAAAADALARRRARRRAALAAKGELPRGACRRENLPLSWKKLDLAIKLVRRRPVDDALAQLAAVPRKSASLLRAAVANAAANAVDAGGDPSRLVVEKVWVTKGRTTKRLWIMSKGYSSARETRRSHLNVEVAEAPEGAEFLAAGAVKRRAGRRSKSGGGEEHVVHLAPQGDAAARDAARQLALARKRRFESARFVAPAATTRWAAARGGGGGAATTTA